MLFTLFFYCNSVLCILKLVVSSTLILVIYTNNGLKSPVPTVSGCTMRGVTCSYCTPHGTSRNSRDGASSFGIVKFYQYDTPNGAFQPIIRIIYNLLNPKTIKLRFSSKKLSNFKYCLIINLILNSFSIRNAEIIKAHFQADYIFTRLIIF